MAEELGLFGEEPEFNPPAPAPAPEPAPAPVVEPAPEAAKPEEPKGEKVDASPASERPRDEQGRFAPKTDAEHQVPLSAMMAERDRRQAAEKQLEELKATAPKADIWADPDGFVKAKLEEMKPVILGEAESRAAERFFWYTVDAATQRHSGEAVKYEAANEAFAELAKNDPLMVQKLRESRDPGEFVYQQGKRALELKEVGGDLAAYRKRIETEVRQDMEAKAAARQTRNDGIPQSLNSEPSKGAGVVGGTWAGPTPVETLFPER